LAPFAEVIPPCWREEVLEAPDSPLKQPVVYAVMQGFGSLASLLFTRMLRICKEGKEDRSLIKDLRLIFSVTLQTMRGLSLRRKAVFQAHPNASSLEEEQFLMSDNRKYIELGFLKIILDFFNYHVSMARRDHISRAKADWLVTRLLPSFKEMRQSLDHYYVHEDVSSSFPLLNLKPLLILRTLLFTS
jgi:hypothetical protein